MRLSIIIPVYNVASYLKETVQSVLGQTYTDFELILVDDGSTDGSGELCNTLSARDGRIRVIHQKNSGVSVARNTGIAAVRGEYIGFVDSDDLIEPDMYAILMSLADSTDADIVQCRHNRNNRIENKPRILDVTYKNGEQFVTDILKHTGREYTNQVSLCSKMFKKGLFESIKFPPGQDYEDEQETYKICLKAKKIALISDELYHYVKRENSIITGVSCKKMLDKQTALCDRLHYLPQVLPELKDLCARSFCNYSFCILSQLYAEKDFVSYKKAKAVLLAERRLIKKSETIYGKLYLYWLTIPGLEQWLMKTSCEPIQGLIRKIKRIDS